MFSGALDFVPAGLATRCGRGVRAPTEERVKDADDGANKQ